ncbi:MAG: hypothetical protein U5J83_09175 [Bryobacterales bacterium]|nr:hypothetical protein [Bryobacterales bacterium]
MLQPCSRSKLPRGFVAPAEAFERNGKADLGKVVALRVRFGGSGQVGDALLVSVDEKKLDAKLGVGAGIVGPNSLSTHRGGNRFGGFAQRREHFGEVDVRLKMNPA